MQVTTIRRAWKSTFKCLFKCLGWKEAVFWNYVGYQWGNRALIYPLTSEQMARGGLSHGIFSPKMGKLLKCDFLCFQTAWRWMTIKDKHPAIRGHRDALCSGCSTSRMVQWHLTAAPLICRVPSEEGHSSAATQQRGPSLKRILKQVNGCKQLSNFTASESRLEMVSAQSGTAEEYYGKIKVGEWGRKVIRNYYTGYIF